MTPYIVTTKERIGGTDLVIPGERTVSRRAVATLDEARELAATAAGNAGNWSNTLDAALCRGAAKQARALSESGGPVGPLPDGTTIEVELIGWPELERCGRYTAPTGPYPGPRDDDAIIAAYNREARA